MRTSGIICNWKRWRLRAAERRRVYEKTCKLAASSFCRVFAALLGLLSCAILNGTAQAKGSMLDPVSTQVATGYLYSCALTTGGQVLCWGSNTYGQLGNGTAINSVVPVAVSGLASVVSIAAGEDHTCALTTSGKVWCWGANNKGQLGDGTTTNHLTPVAVANLDNVAAITAGQRHTCALTTVGAVYCWGDNGVGQLGDGSTAAETSPVAVLNLASGVVAISAGSGFHTCALTDAGGVECWGYNDYGQIGDGSTTTRATPVLVSGLSSGVVSVSAGYRHTCALTSTGSARCWGSNFEGRLGDGTSTDRPTPVDVKNLSNAIAVTAGGEHSCAVVKDGAAYCWGKNVEGQLGDGSGLDQTTPARVKGNGSFTAVVGGLDHTCALTAIGGVECWGYNAYGQLGDGTTTNRNAPVGVYGLSSRITALAAGEVHTCALVADIVQCWGSNGYGQLGDGTTTSHGTPATVPGLANVSALAAGSFYTCALTTGGSVWCWGSNNFGQLGDGTTADRHNPVAVVGLPAGIVAITAGHAHACALTLAGAIWCWGHNNSGQLGDGTTTNRANPVAVSGMAGGIRSVVAGEDHTCSLTAAGVMACWGANAVGQLGDGTTTNRSLPVGVSGLPGPVAIIAAGRLHTCVQTTSNVLMCWGRNEHGQIGDGTTTDRTNPTCPVSFCAVGAIDGLWSGSTAYHAWARVRNQAAVWGWGWNLYGQLGLGDALAGMDQLQAMRNSAFNGLAPGFTVAAGSGHTCVSDDAGLRCMGYNGFGQLDDGTTTQRNSPVPVLAGQSINFSVPTTLTVGSTFTLTATADSGLPVTFDSWTPSTCTVTGNTLKITAAALCGVRASQVGGTLSAGGSAAAAPQQLRLIQAVSATTTTLTSSVNPSALSQSVTFTATVTGIAPTGTVTFSDGATVLCSAVALTGAGNSPTATCTTTTLALGTHPITAAYSGGAGNAASSSPVLNQIVQTTAGTVALASSLNPSMVGQSVTFTATVTGTAPTGTVTFKDATATLCNGIALAGAGNTRTAVCSSAALTAGTHNMTATYSGDSSNAAATSAVLVQTVQTAGLTPTTTFLNLSPSPATVGQSVTATVTVRPTSGTAVPSGTVTVSGGTTSCTVTLSAGAGSCTLVFAAAGAYTVTASYGGSGTHATSSTTATVTVKASTSAATVAAPMLDPRNLGALAFGLLALAWRFCPRRP